jgi:purine-binding chemotaxis protein CheW
MTVPTNAPSNALAAAMTGKLRPDRWRPGEPRKIVTFRVEDRVFAVDVAAVREIKGWHSTTPLPHVPAHVRGVINLRGMILAVYDLRARIGLGATAATLSHVILVVDLEDRVAGLLVDAVSDIVDVPADSIHPPPAVSSGEQLIAAVAIIDEQVVSLLDLERTIGHRPATSLTMPATPAEAPSPGPSATLAA